MSKFKPSVRSNMTSTFVTVRAKPTPKVNTPLQTIRISSESPHSSGEKHPISNHSSPVSQKRLRTGLVDKENQLPTFVLPPLDKGKGRAISQPILLDGDPFIDNKPRFPSLSSIPRGRLERLYHYNTDKLHQIVGEILAHGRGEEPCADIELLMSIQELIHDRSRQMKELLNTSTEDNSTQYSHSSTSTSFLPPSTPSPQEPITSPRKAAVPNVIPSSNISREALETLHRVFGLDDFRENQLAAITSTMQGTDTLVLMPTGGGKSLCYQLPAVIENQLTGPRFGRRGVTLVFSPLISLMQDQVAGLIEKGIEALKWTSESKDGQAVYRRLRGPFRPPLLYVAPEKLEASSQFQGILTELYNKDQIARFVIDEAHCVSTWGRDFREAYQQLGALRVRYPLVPILALTATATAAVANDIRLQLKLSPDCTFLQESSNRPNLKYIVKYKPARDKLVNEIFNFITTHHRESSGIIYCLSKLDCEKLASDLQKQGLRASFFHADLAPSEKEQILHDWQNDQCRIVVATIAFGMGIDKANVRFVVHHALPTSLDGYYQETGRAGRDGHPADCLLYYNIKDIYRRKRMIFRSDELNPGSRERQLEALRTVIQYVMNISDCRRKQVLQHFGEAFDSGLCRGLCDNCLYDGHILEKDLTNESREIVSLVGSMCARLERVALTLVLDVYRGSKSVAVRDKRCDEEPMYGKGKGLPKELAEQLFQHLVALEILELVLVENGSFSNQYLEVGSVEQLGSVIVKYRPKPGKASVPEKHQSQSTPRKRIASPVSGESQDPEESMDLYAEDSFSQESYVIDLSKSPTPPPPSRPDSNEVLYGQLRQTRRKLKIAYHLTSEQEVISDEKLELLSLKCPQDYFALKEVLKEPNSNHNGIKQELLRTCVAYKLQTEFKRDT